MKITKKMREEAICRLECAADAEESGTPWVASCDHAGLWCSVRHDPADSLAYAADDAVMTLIHGDFREAAALLRDGWSPGDPVVRRGGGS